MAKGAKALAEQMKQRDEKYAQQYQQAATAAATPSPAETQREDERKGYFDWKAKGDYRKPPPSLVNLALSDPAAARQKREMELGTIGTGAFGLGSANANPTAVALAKENMADTNDKENASNYESQVRAEDMYQRTDNAGLLMAQDWARKSGLLSSSGNMSQFQTQQRIATQPQSILPMILSGALGVGGALLGNPSLFAAGATKAGHP